LNQKQSKNKTALPHSLSSDGLGGLTPKKLDYPTGPVSPTNSRAFDPRRESHGESYRKPSERVHYYNDPTSIDTLNNFYDLNGADFSFIDQISLSEQGFLNVRWPRELLFSVNCLSKFITDNNIQPEDWATTPLSQLIKKYPYGTHQYTIGDVLSLCVSCIKKETTLWWLENKDDFIMSPGGVRNRRWLEKQFNEFTHHRIHSKHDDRNILAKSYESFRNIVFCVLQANKLMTKDVCKDGLCHYGYDQSGPVMPDIMCIDFHVESKTQLEDDCHFVITFRGKNIESAPIFHVNFHCSKTGHNYVVPHQQLKKRGPGVFEGKVKDWHKCPEGSWITLEMKTESAFDNFAKFTPHDVHVKCLKPYGKQFINFNLSDMVHIEDEHEFYHGGVIFAETLGDSKDVHYHFRQPIRVKTIRDHVIRVLNASTGRSIIIPMDDCPNIDEYIFHHFPDGDRGFGDLSYKTSTGELEKTIDFSHEHHSYIIQQVQISKKHLHPKYTAVEKFQAWK